MEAFIKGVNISVLRDSHIGKNLYKEFTCSYGEIHVQGGIHIRSSHISLEGFIKGVHIYLWRNLHVGSDSYKEVTYIYGEIHMKGVIHIRISHVSMTGLIYRERFI